MPRLSVLRRPGASSGRVSLLASALLTVGLLTGCGSGSGGHVATPSGPPSSPTAAAPSPVSGSPALRGFYGQTLTWHPCGSQQCATLTVPVDYSHPAGTTIGIAVVRQRSSGPHEGSLIVNPGGPGASGVQFVHQAASAFSQLTDHFDLVSFDPRGVGASHPVRCLSSAQLDAYIHIDPSPTTAAQRGAVVAASRRFADACFARNGSFLDHIATIDQARDMDVLRAALGDAKLTYYGASYGTYLGAKYAQLFPTRIRAMVLDGALNPAESGTASNGVQAHGFETDLDDFLASCARSSACPLGSTEAAAASTVTGLERRVTGHPETVGSRSLGPGELFEGLAAGLYSPLDWTSLQQALAQARQGRGAAMLAFSDSLTERSSNGHYSNLVESNIAINCIDRPWPRAVSSYQAAARQFASQSPTFGAPIEWGSLPCALWKVPPVESTHPVSAPGAPPILVIGTTRDPATPYVWAQSLAHQLSSGVLLTYSGDGHTAYLRGDSCVDGAVKSYVERLRAPAAGTRCS